MEFKCKLNEDQNGLIITKGIGCEGEVVIPSELEQEGKMLPVIAIRGCAFANNSAITKITIPHTINKIDADAFFSCSGLDSVVVDPNNPDYDSRDNCNAIIETATNTLILGCHNTVIPDTVVALGENAFFRCIKMTALFIPKSVAIIDFGTFFGCYGLTSIVVEKENSCYDSRDNCNAIIETATNTLIRGCAATILPDSVTHVIDCAYAECLNINTIIIPKTETEISTMAYHGCEGLTSIEIPNTVTRIGSCSFSRCLGLTSVTIPDSVTVIEAGAFAFCGNLTTVVIPDSVTKIGKAAFDKCSNLRKIVISNASLLKNAGVPEGVEIVTP